MKLLRLGWGLIVALIWVATIQSQGVVSSPASKLYWEAVVLHGESKLPAAADKMKAALKFDPKNKLYLDYHTELKALVTREALDQHALKATPEVEQTVESLAKHLVKPAKNDREKARLIYRWITDRIAYDYETYRQVIALFQKNDALGAKLPEQNAAAVLARRKCVCEGFCNLFQRLGQEAGLEVVIVVGHVHPGVGRLLGLPEEQTQKIPHAWNAVKIDGDWCLLEVTWSAARMQAKTNEARQFQTSINEFFFLTPPDRFFLHHYPKDAKWQLLPKVLGRDEFERQPLVWPTLFDMGFNAADFQAKVVDKNCREMVLAQAPPGPKVSLLKVPLDQTLKAGTPYTIRIQAPGFQQMALFNEQQFVMALTQKGQIFEGTVTPTKGRLLVGGYVHENTNGQTILVYNVE